MKKAVLVVAFAGLLAIPGTSSGAGKTVNATDSRTWSPSSVSIGKGGKVTWRNNSDDDHNLVAYGGWKMSQTLNEGQSASKRFTKAGTYAYRCTLHSELDGKRCTGMCGKVRVK